MRVLPLLSWIERFPGWWYTHVHRPGNRSKLTYRPDLDVLAARWLRPVTRDKIQQSYGALLAEAGRRRCRCWLPDWRRRRNTHQLGAG